jgi:hypothetical protein
MIRLVTRQFWQVLIRFGPVVMWIVGAVLVIISCALLVYLTAVLAARLVLWAYLP